MQFIYQIAIAASFILSIHAEPALVISLDNVSDRVHSQNPDLAAARWRISEALGQSHQAGLPDNPQLGTSIAHNQNFNEGRFEIGLSQRFPLTNRLQVEKEISLTSLRAAESEVLEVERILVRDARLAVVNILSTQARRRLLRNQSDLALGFADNLTKAAQKGESSPLDAAAAKLEAAAIAVELKQLDAAEAAAIGILKPLLGVQPGNDLHVTGNLDAPIIPRKPIDPSRRPDYQVARFQIEAARRGIDLEYARRYDDVEAGLFAAAERSEDAPEGLENEAVIGLQFKIALPFWNQNKGGIEQATATHERRKQEAVALGRKIQLEAQADRAQMQEWAQLINELDLELLPLATQQSESAVDAFAKGLSDIQTVFRSRERRLQLESAKLDAIREFHLARVRYEAAAGNY